MKRTRKVAVTVLVTFLLGCLLFAGIAVYADRSDSASRDGEAYNAVMETLLGLAGVEVEDENAEVLAGRRLSQNLTVTTDDGVIVSGGTVTKIQDDFYPGSYKITFSKKAILTSRAVVEVQMEVNKGDEVYILIGDKESGYTEYACVTAKEDNVVSFDTNVLQDYTLSKTDIKSAQEAMANILSTESIQSTDNTEN